MRLQTLVREAPANYRCALDGELMLDPVQSPHGHIFERASLVRVLGVAAGRCPLTGHALALQDCARLPGLRREVSIWVREQYSRGRSAAQSAKGADAHLLS
mmetsp:Transcript_177520/g.563173  ORF Transcript_177520/g.563173 Transcript_177520/m.563173 type:complete len:101 (-) Transcript_177520:386-688(-)